MTDGPPSGGHCSGAHAPEQVRGSRRRRRRRCATGSSSPTRSTTPCRARRRSCSSRRGRSSRRGSGRRRSASSRGTTASITFDGRGSGRSGRPVGAAAYTDVEYAADIVAVLDATGTEHGRAGHRVVRRVVGGARRRQAPVARDRPAGHRAVVRAGRRHARPRPRPVRRAARHHPAAGPSTTSTTGSAAGTTTSSGSSSRGCSPSRTRPSRSRTASAGRTRSRRRRSRTARPAGSAATARCASRSSRSRAGSRARCSSCTAPTTGSARTRSASGWPSSPAATSSCSRTPATVRRRATPVKVNHLIAQFVDRLHPRPPRTTWRRADGPTEAGAVPLVARSVSGTRSATSRSRPSCVPGSRTCRSTGWRRTR